jgi:hypothetical protein
MKVKTLTAAALIAISGAFAATAGAAGRAATEVTIKGTDGDYYGYVKSPDEGNCEDGRKVNVYKLKGSNPDPQTDKKIGSDTAQPNGPNAMWSIGNSGYKHGKFYAHAKKTDYCKGDFSPVINR